MDEDMAAYSCSEATRSRQQHGHLTGALRIASALERSLLRCASVVGRITEEHLSEAEKTFPGIVAKYLGMRDKPRTFLHLLWAYESELAAGSNTSLPVAGSSN